MEGWSDSSMKKVNRETVSVLSFEPHLYLLIHFGHVTHFFLDPRDAAVKDGRRGWEKWRKTEEEEEIWYDVEEKRVNL